MIPATTRELLYSTHLKGDEELYIKKDSIVVIHEKKGNILTLDLNVLRCALATSHETFKVFWRAPKNKKNTQWKYFERYQQEFKLDLKKAFPDKKQRRMAEKTESKRIVTIILHAIQNTHSINEPNTKANLAMHTGEYVRGIYEGQCKIGKGELVITNLGIYFVSFDKGLYTDLPLDLLDSYDAKNKTVRIHYFEPMWVDGYDASSKKNRKFEVRIKDEEASVVCETITAAYADGGAKEIREFQTLTEEFGSMTPDELHAAYYTGKFGVHKPIDKYFAILAKRKWGIPNTPTVALKDIHVVAACLTTGMPLDSAGELLKSDKYYRDATVEYVKNHDAYMKQYEQLQLDLEDIINENLDDEEKESLKRCHPRVIDDTLRHLAKTGNIPESFEPESLIKWKKFTKGFNEDVIGQGLPDYPNGLDFDWKYEIVCHWSVQDSKRITKNKDFVSITDAIKSLDEKYEPDLQSTPPIHPVVFAKLYEGYQNNTAEMRIGRVYEKWCKTNPLSEFNDPNDKSWVQYVTDSLDETKIERVKDYLDAKETPVEHLRRCESEAQNKKTRLERSIKPRDILDKDIYSDAWFDGEKHRWFSTNPHFRITDPGVIMTPDECEQKYGFRAMVYSEDAVKFKHGMPAVYNEDKKWWILLCTVPEEKITKEMVHDKWWPRSLRYDTVESVAGVSDSGQIDYGTVQEAIFYAEHETDIPGGLAPFNERLRRLFFASVVACQVSIQRKEKTLEEPITV